MFHHTYITYGFCVTVMAFLLDIQCVSCVVYSAQINSAEDMLRALKNYIRLYMLAQRQRHQTPILNMLKPIPFIHFAHFAPCSRIKCEIFPSLSMCSKLALVRIRAVQCQKRNGSRGKKTVWIQNPDIKSTLNFIGWSTLHEFLSNSPSPHVCVRVKSHSFHKFSQ